MERLTERAKNGTAVYKHPTPEPEGWKANRHQVLERCCQYEDTGLTPEDIMELKEFYSNPLNTAVPALQMSQWIPANEPPETDDYVLLSFENFSCPQIGRYEHNEDGSGNWYLGDCDEGDTCLAQDLYVNAWMPLPEQYQGEE